MGLIETHYMQVCNSQTTKRGEKKEKLAFSLQFDPNEVTPYVLHLVSLYPLLSIRPTGHGSDATSPPSLTFFICEMGMTIGSTTNDHQGRQMAQCR